MILVALGKNARLDLGYKRTDGMHLIGLGVFEVMWNNKTKRWGFGLGLPYIIGIGIFFKERRV